MSEKDFQHRVLLVLVYIAGLVTIMAGLLPGKFLEILEALK